VETLRDEYAFGPGASLAPWFLRCYVPPMGRMEKVVNPAIPLQEAASFQDRDAKLIRAATKGDQTALAELYDRYGALLSALGQRILGNRREVEDLLHDVFIEAWRHAKDYDPSRGTVRAWLVMRMRSRALDRVRAAGRAKVLLQDEAKMPEREAPDDPSVAPDQARVRAAVAELPEDQRVVLELGYFQGMTSSEIAKELSVPIGTVKSRVARGLASLRAALKEGEER
jgi:RNA polymerase sigma-70 factor, ECF subfamily